MLAYLLCVAFLVDIISAIEFNKTGNYLATGDKGGRVVLFERMDNKDVCLYLSLYYFLPFKVLSAYVLNYFYILLNYIA